MVRIQIGAQFWSLPAKQVMGVTTTEGTEGLIKRPDWKPGGTLFCQPRNVDTINASKLAFEAEDRPKSGPGRIASGFFEIWSKPPYKVGEKVRGENQRFAPISLDASAAVPRITLGQPSVSLDPNSEPIGARIPLTVDGIHFDPVECHAMPSYMGFDRNAGPWIVGCRVTLAIDSGNYLMISSGGFHAGDRNVLMRNFTDGIELARRISYLKRGN